jgi:eukaryotic-like serine/threonine-protein kinase
MQQLPRFAPDELKGLLPQLQAVGEAVTPGGQKSVYRCTIDGQEWALKLMDAAQTAVEAVRRAQREVAVLQRCNSPYLVKLGPISFGQGTVAGVSVVYFTEEWVAGRNLADIIQQDGPLSVAEVIKLGKQVASAIGALWGMKCVHRDVKPLNIMRREPSGEYVLLDLGLALILERSSLTPTGATVGTVPYYSPEQMLPTRRLLDCRSDLFSLGVVLYEAVTGAHPFATAEMTREEVWRAISVDQPADPSSLVPDLPEELRSVILRLLEKQPHMRYRTCAAVVDALGYVRL